MKGEDELFKIYKQMKTEKIKIIKDLSISIEKKQKMLSVIFNKYCRDNSDLLKKIRESAIEELKHGRKNKTIKLKR